MKKKIVKKNIVHKNERREEKNYRKESTNEMKNRDSDLFCRSRGSKFGHCEFGFDVLLSMARRLTSSAQLLSDHFLR